MIEVTRLNGVVYYINPHQIEYIELNPDTTITMLSGKRLVVQEDYQLRTFDTVVSQIPPYPNCGCFPEFFYVYQLLRQGGCSGFGRLPAIVEEARI